MIWPDEARRAGALGVELVQNGDMSNIADLVAVAATIAVVAGGVEITDTAAGSGRAGKPFQVEAGKVYLLQVILAGGTSATASIRVSASSALYLLDSLQRTTTATTTTLELMLRASTSGTYYIVAAGDSPTGSTLIVTKMSAREVLGL